MTILKKMHIQWKKNLKNNNIIFNIHNIMHKLKFNIIGDDKVGKKSYVNRIRAGAYTDNKI